MKTNDLRLEALVRHWRLMSAADPSEIVQLHRVPCRHCYGIGHHYQYTPAEFAKAKQEWEFGLLGKCSIDPENLPPFPHAASEGDWYNKRHEPKPDCPECFGDGCPEVFLKDTRTLSEAARALFLTAVDGPYGINVMLADKELAALGLELVAQGYQFKDFERLFNRASSTEVLK